jgi:hypothetical protein
MSNEIPGKRLATERQTADYLKCKPTTLTQSRWSGRLFGLPAPKYMKLGRMIRYDLNEIDAWLEKHAEES